VFTLQPGQFTPVIQTKYGFHIVEVVERQLEHPLTPDALLALQHLALENWVVEHQEQGTIEVLLN
jgi:hypothetical protein